MEVQIHYSVNIFIERDITDVKMVREWISVFIK